MAEASGAVAGNAVPESERKMRGAVKRKHLVDDDVDVVVVVVDEDAGAGDVWLLVSVEDAEEGLDGGAGEGMNPNHTRRVHPLSSSRALPESL